MRHGDYAALADIAESWAYDFAEILRFRNIFLSHMNLLMEMLEVPKEVGEPDKLGTGRCQRQISNL